MVRSDPTAPASLAVGAGAAAVRRIRTPAPCWARETGRACARSSASWSSGTAMSRRRATSRPIGRAMTGAANLHVPLHRRSAGSFSGGRASWTWAAVRSITWFKGGLRGKARDFNWHNTIGFWSAIPLAIIVAGGVVISYPWATGLVYRAYGEAPPAPAGAAARGGGPGGRGAGAGARGGGPGASAAEASKRGRSRERFTSLRVRNSRVCRSTA